MRKKKTRPGYRFVQLVNTKSGARYRGWARIAGKRVFGPLTDDAKQAHEEALELRKDGPASPLMAETLTLGDAIELVKERHEVEERSPDTVAWFAGQCRVLQREWPGSMPLQAIDHRAIQRFVSKRMKEERTIKDENGKSRRERKVSASTLQHHKRALSLIFEQAIHEGFLNLNPVRRVSWPKVDAKRMHYFEHEALVRIIETVRVESESDADLIRFLYLTGLRRMEAARVRIEDIDFNADVVWVHGKRRREEMPFEESTRKVLERMVERAREGLLVPDGAKGITAVFRRWARQLKEPKLTAHSMRHSFASHLAKIVNPHVLQALTRHRSPQMVARYVHVANADLRAALRRASASDGDRGSAADAPA